MLLNPKKICVFNQLKFGSNLYTCIYWFEVKMVCGFAMPLSSEKGITNSVASCTMYIELGKKLYISMGSEKNLKLTTTEAKVVWNWMS